MNRAKSADILRHVLTSLISALVAAIISHYVQNIYLVIASCIWVVAVTGFAIAYEKLCDEQKAIMDRMEASTKEALRLMREWRKEVERLRP